MSFPCLKLWAPVFHQQFHTPYHDCSFTPLPPSGRLPAIFPTIRKASYPFLCPVDHCCGTCIKAGVVFPSPAPKPGLSPAGEALVGQRHSLPCVPAAQSPRPATPPHDRHPQRRGTPARQGPLPSTLPSVRTQTNARQFSQRLRQCCFKLRDRAGFQRQKKLERMNIFFLH